MNYQTVLQNYHPTEQGDFMLRYEIGGRGYVVYSPEKDALSCIELHGFSELTPWQLAFVLSLDMQQMKEQDEFSLSVCCKREKLLSYLFDVEESETVLKTKHVSGWQGYLMMDIHKPDRVRNVFQFPDSLPYRVDAFPVDTGQPLQGVVPIFRQGEHLGE
jgi:hypothetical protein